jgi:hypothetical protein
VLAADGSAHATGNDTTEDTLATIPVPANSMGANSCLQINTLWDYTGSTNSKSLRVRFSGASGTAYLSVATSTASNVSANYITRICNRNATNSQIGGAAGGAIGVATAGLTTSSVDTSAPTTIVITGQKGSAGETLQLDAYEVSL